MRMPEAAQRLDAAIRLQFRGEPVLEIVERKGLGTSKHGANGLGRSIESGCRWAALSALRDLQAEARHYGANAVVDIRNPPTTGAPPPATAYRCHAGAFATRVELTGVYAIVAERAGPTPAAETAETK